MTKRRKPAPEETTNFSWAEAYIDDLKRGKYVRIQVGFPFVTGNRKAGGNVDYTNPRLNRSTRGRVPTEDLDLNNLSISKPRPLTSSEFLFINDANNGSNVPEGYYATSSGIFPIDFTPFSENDPAGPPTDKPTVIKNLDTKGEGSGEFFIAKNIRLANMLGITEYYPVNPGGPVGMFNWEIIGEYQTPVYPQLRYPRGAKRKAFFKN